MSLQGYYRYPTIHKNTIVFSSEDDLWEVSAEGGIARRLTSGRGSASHPQFSSDGNWIAFSSTEEGHGEVYVISAEGGSAKRLTHMGDMATVIGWLDAETILFSSSWKSPFEQFPEIFTISLHGGLPKKLPVGPARFAHRDPNGKGCVIQRHGYREYAYWKRYKGGMAGQIWIDPAGDGKFEKLFDQEASFSHPLWYGDRLFFLSDFEGHGNLYSSKLDGSDITQEATIQNYYIRSLSTDGESFVFNGGGDLYFLNPRMKAHHKVIIDYPSAQTQRNRKYVPARRYIQDFDLHPQGHHTTVTARGRAIAFSNFEGPTLPFGQEKAGRYRLSRWLHDGKRLVVVNDTDGEEKLEIYNGETLEQLDKMEKATIGRVVDLITSPVGDEVILTNHKNELVHVNLKTWAVTALDQGKDGFLSGMDWSPDGKWVAYGCPLSRHLSIIKLVELKSGKITPVTKPVLRDESPSFDPEGKYLYFIASREFNATYDTLQFDLGFPKGSRPYLVTLQKDLENPFVDKPSALEAADSRAETAEKQGRKKPNKLKIDLKGIENRVIPFPVRGGYYTSVTGLKGKVIYTKCALTGSEEGEAHGSSLYVYDFEHQKTQNTLNHVTHYEVSKDLQWLIYKDDEENMRVVKADEKPDDSDEASLKKAGWLNLSRLRVPVHPDYEWLQIYKEAWRLQRDHFWVEDMSQVDWLKIYNRYLPLVSRVGTRAELSDLLWEMQGELGTSHAYVQGGDEKKSPKYTVGMLGADFEYVKSQDAYKITHIVQGDVWKKGAGSPLAQPGLNIKVGDSITELAGVKLSQEVTPHEALVNYAHQEVRLKVKSGKTERVLTVKTLRSEYKARYREWVETNRDYVHKATKGQIGYVHIPDMGDKGFAEFHRSFLHECDRDGLVVDVRFNRGGHVSPLLLEKLARRHLGYDLSRWIGVVPYPEDSVPGPLVAITNEYAGSDGDMFSHAFKMMKLGKLIGQRTWGGVIGIEPRHMLVDKGYTTQPEYSFWFKDVGWKLENYGAEPDLDVEIDPADYVAEKDPQLDKAIEIVLEELKENPVQKPDFSQRPNLKLPA